MVSSVKKLKELVKSKNKNFFSEGLDSSWALVEFEGVGIHFFTEKRSTTISRIYFLIAI